MLNTRYTAIFIFTFLISIYHLYAQDHSRFEEDVVKEYVKHTFQSSRIINAHSVETVNARGLDIRIAHRFGDIAGANGGFHSLFGFDQSADIRVAFEYGITDRLTVAAGRSKGAGSVKELWDSYIKYSLLRQTKNNENPFSVAVFVNAVVSSQRADTTNLYLESSFREFSHRMSYTSQLIIARKFGEYLSLAVMPSVVYRNYVAFGDENSLFSLGLGGRIRLSKMSALLLEYYYTFSDYRNDNSDIFFSPLGIGLEINTGGHVFHLNFTNATGIISNDYIPYTKSSWLQGEFRFGFTISRVFNL